MNDVIWQSIGAILLLVGIVGCVVPVIPGPVLAFGGLLCLLPTAHALSSTAFCVWGGVTALVVVLDYAVPMMGAKVFHCSRWGTFGCFVGTIVGVFFFPLGLILGPFLGAFLGELIAERKVSESIVGGLGALFGFLTGTLLKLLACSVMAYVFVHAIWGIGPELF